MPSTPVTRRKAVITSCCLFGPIISGCLSNSSRQKPEGTTRTPMTDSDKSSRVQLSFNANFYKQLSTSSPPQFKVWLKNDGDQDVYIRMGAGLFWSVDAEYPKDLRIMRISDKSGDFTVTSTDECWEHQEPIPIPAMSTMKQLSPGELITNKFVVFNNNEDECYMSGEYHMKDVIEIDKKAYELVTMINISNNRTFTIETSPSVLTIV